MTELLDRLDLNSLNDLLFGIQTRTYTKKEALALFGASTTGVNDVRLEYVSNVLLQLAGLPGTTKTIAINGEVVDCSSFPTRAPTDNLISSTGADAAAAPVVNTFYSAYMSNSLATTFPGELRLSATAHTDGYLGATGNALNWKLVGWVRTIDSTGAKFAFSDTQRLVCSKFNPRFLRCYVTESTGHAYATGTWRKWNNADGTKLEFIVHEDHLAASIGIAAGITFTLTLATAYGGAIGIGVDSTSAIVAPVNPGVAHAAATATTEARTHYVVGNHTHLAAAGYHYTHLLEYGITAGGATFDDGTMSIGLFL